MASLVQGLTDPNPEKSKKVSPRFDSDSARLFGISTWSVAVALWVQRGGRQIPLVFREYPVTYNVFAVLIGFAFFTSFGALCSYAWPRPLPKLGLILKWCSGIFVFAVLVLVTVLMFRCLIWESYCQ